MKILLAPYARKMRNNEENPKNYPFFPELIELLKGNDIIQLGVEGEKQLVPDFRKNLSIKEIKALLQVCDFWISVDSFLQHLAYHVNKKGVVLWSISDPKIFGYPTNLNILKDKGYLRAKQFDIWEAEIFDSNKFLQAEEVYKLVHKEFNLT